MTHPYVFGWYSIVSKFTPAVRAKFPADVPLVKKAEAKADDDFDPFGDDMDDVRI